MPDTPIPFIAPSMAREQEVSFAVVEPVPLLNLILWVHSRLRARLFPTHFKSLQDIWLACNARLPGHFVFVPLRSWKMPETKTASVISWSQPFEYFTHYGKPYSFKKWHQFPISNGIRHASLPPQANVSTSHASPCWCSWNMEVWSRFGSLTGGVIAPTQEEKFFFPLLDPILNSTISKYVNIIGLFLGWCFVRCSKGTVSLYCPSHLKIRNTWIYCGVHIRDFDVKFSDGLFSSAVDEAYDDRLNSSKMSCRTTFWTSSDGLHAWFQEELMCIGYVHLTKLHANNDG